VRLEALCSLRQLRGIPVLILQRFFGLPIVWFGLVSLPPLGTGVIDVVLAKRTPLFYPPFPSIPASFTFLSLHLHINLSTLGCFLSPSGSSSLTSSPSCSREKKTRPSEDKKRESKEREKKKKGKFSSGAFSLRQAQPQPHSSPALIAFLFLVYTFAGDDTHDTTLSAFSLQLVTHIDTHSEHALFPPLI
jgi:hypothetical protein